MSALKVRRSLHVMTRGQSKAAEQSGQTDQGAEQQRHAAEADHDMDVGTDTDVDQVMESGDAVQPEQSESASLGAEADFKARVRAA